MSGSPSSLRVIRSPASTPPENMALDVALLHAGEDVALRLYTWKPAGLSIGWFQDPSGFRDVPGEHVLVRRPTGGGAIYHDDELTFALVGPASFLGDTDSLYDRVHDAIGRALAGCGVSSRRIRDGAAGPGARALRSAWCFAHPARHDLVAPDGRKLVGSAQRRLTGSSRRVLQHGSVPMRCPAATPFSAAIADQVDPDRIRADFEAAVVEELARALALPAREGGPTAAETARAADLATTFLVHRDLTCPTSNPC